jgi:diguanylate cyclase (GGDEF)-like protein
MKTKVLIVDDDTAIRESIQEYLTLIKFNAIAVASAEDAIDYLEKNTVDIVITDILMTGMDGFELTDFIKKNYNTEVIVITGYSAEYSYEEAISKGANDFIFKPVRFEELNLRIKRVLRESNLAKDRIEMLEELKTLSITDGLTKLYNSRHFYNQLELEIERLKRYKHPLSLLLLDIDDFKAYNDKYGHIEGDKVLMIIGKIIQSCLRTMDSGYRYGGEEFTVLLPETNSTQAKLVATRIKNELSNNVIKANGDENIITVSIGLTEYNYDEDIKNFIKRADMAMYKSKEKGKNTISCIEPEK